MGRLLLATRLALRDLRRRRAEAVLLLLAVLTATTTLTLGLVVRDAATGPFQHTRAATNGPDVLVAGPAAKVAAMTVPAGVTGRSGPFPVAAGELRAGDWSSDVQVVGRDVAHTAIDQPAVTGGGWVRDGAVVAEAAFAAAAGLHPGDRVTLNGRSFDVAGVAVSAASAPYPGSACLVPTGCLHGTSPEDQPLPPEVLENPGLLWATRADTVALGADNAVLSLTLADPAGAPAVAAATAPLDLMVMPWQTIRDEATELAGDARILLMIGAWLLGLLAVASLSVLTGGRMADQTRRVGLLKAAGGTPGLVAAVLLTEYVLVALVAAAAGLAIGALTAPLLTESGAGLLGAASTPGIGLSTAGTVVAVALAVAVAATVVPVLRAARSSTVGALADAARPPRRTGWLIALSARLPVPLLLALRVAARRPRRTALAVISVAVTVSGIYVLLVLDAFLRTRPFPGGYTESQVEVLRHVLMVWTVVLLCLAAVNAVVITWVTVLDNRRSSALTRALGATGGEVSAALAAAQVLPALAGAVLGVFPGGVGLFALIMAVTGGDGDRATAPPAGVLLLLVALVVVAVAALTAGPARLGARRPVTEAL